jgi:hypothetical protein
VTGAGATDADRLQALRGVCFCLLYDLCCWLAGAEEPVPDETTEYALTPLRAIEEPRRRLGGYASQALLVSWERALEPFFASGATLDPELGESGPLRHEGLDDGGRVLAELRFTNRSRVRDDAGRSYQLPAQDWVLSVWLSPDLSRVESATLARA